MRKLLAIALVLGLVGVAGAYELGSQAPAKATPVVPHNVPNPDRQGGDTVLNATVIGGDLPYNDSGTTAGYTDDYDEICPYTQSFSADVVYSYTPSADVDVNIDLCGSGYDTKLYVYDSGLGLVACNDDFYFDDVCGVYVSKLENVSLMAGQMYYIIVDGYGGDFGDYLIEVSGFVPCVIDCMGEPEGEPDLVNEYTDNWNGGCNTDPTSPPFQTIMGDAAGEQTLCGVSGWYLFGGSGYRDTDWFELIMGPDGVIEVTVDSEEALYIFELSPQDCNAVAVAQQAIGGPCNEAFMTITGYAPGAVVWFWAGPTVFAPPSGNPPAMFDYMVHFSGLEPGVATESATWGSVKALY